MFFTITRSVPHTFSVEVRVQLMLETFQISELVENLRYQNQIMHMLEKTNI